MKEYVNEKIIITLKRKNKDLVIIQMYKPACRGTDEKVEEYGSKRNHENYRKENNKKLVDTQEIIHEIDERKKCSSMDTEEGIRKYRRLKTS